MVRRRKGGSATIAHFFWTPIVLSEPPDGEEGTKEEGKVQRASTKIRGWD